MDSILAVDCGSVTTTALLIDRVDDGYRLLAAGRSPSTHGQPWLDITAGVETVIRQIEKSTGRVLLTPGGRPICPKTPNGQGVDAFLAVCSAGSPLLVALAGLMQDYTLASGRRAAGGTFSSVTRVLSLEAEPQGDGNQAPRRLSAESRIQLIQEGRPDVILLVGGTDGGAKRPVVEMAQAVAMALRVLHQAEKPVVLYAGNAEIRPEIAAILGPVAELKSVDNVRPALNIENLAPAQAELENLYIQRKMHQLPGFQKLSNWSAYAVTPGSKSFEKVVAYLGRQNNLKVIGADIGSGATSLSIEVGGRCHSVICCDAGVGHGLAALLKVVPLEKIGRWLPFELPPEELYNRLLNKSLHPVAVPMNYEDLMIEYAVAREALRLVLNQARAGWPLQPSSGRLDLPWNLIIGAGLTLTGAPEPGYAALLLLDGFEPWGVTSLALDQQGAAVLLGAIAAVQPAAAVEVAARSVFSNLATVVAPYGHGQPGKLALKVKITRVDGAVEAVDVPYGSLEVIPLPAGQKATLQMNPTRHFDVGIGQPGRGASAEVDGGLLGIIIDARGRPLRLPREDGLRQQQLEQWMAKFRVPYAATE